MVKIRVGTRDSFLAIRQARIVIKKIQKISRGEFRFEIVKIKTAGDSGEKGGFKGVFTKEIQDAMLRGEIDIAVHSMKDLQVNMPKNAEVIAILKRDKANDGFFSNKYKTIESLPNGAKVGTSSLRRKMFLKKLRPDVEIVPIRGNINTRFEKMVLQDLDGIILSYCGPQRMKMIKKSRYNQVIDIDKMTPSPGQGAIGVEIFSNHENELLKTVLRKISCKNTFFEVKKERMLGRLAGVFCQTPFACFIKRKKDDIVIKVAFENEETGKSVLVNENISILQVDSRIEEIAVLVKDAL